MSKVLVTNLIFSAFVIPLSRSPVAIKSVDRSRLDHRLAENLESEIRILRTLRHPNIVALWGTEKTDKQIHLLMEYCELGDLSDFIKKKGLVGPFDKFSSRNPFEGPWGGLDENVARWFLGQLGRLLPVQVKVVS